MVVTVSLMFTSVLTYYSHIWPKNFIFVMFSCKAWKTVRDTARKRYVIDCPVGQTDGRKYAQESRDNDK